MAFEAILVSAEAIKFDAAMTMSPLHQSRERERVAPMNQRISRRKMLAATSATIVCALRSGRSPKLRGRYGSPN